MENNNFYTMSDDEIYIAIYSLMKRVAWLEKTVDKLESEIDTLSGANVGDE